MIDNLDLGSVGGCNFYKDIPRVKRDLGPVSIDDGR